MRKAQRSDARLTPWPSDIVAMDEVDVARQRRQGKGWQGAHGNSQ
jgi:hypothetical protein